MCLSSIEMDMEALINKPRPVLESAHQDLTNRCGLELIGFLCIIYELTQLLALTPVERTL